MESAVAVISSLGPLLAGPAGGLVAVIMVLSGGTIVFVKYLLPLIKDWMKSQDLRFDDIIDEHRKDRRTFEKTIEQIVSGLTGIKDRVEHIEQIINKEK